MWPPWASTRTHSSCVRSNAGTVRASSATKPGGRLPRPPHASELKMPLFHEIVVRQARPAVSARSVRDAYLITLNECGGLNFGRMAALLGPGSNPDDIRDALAADGLIFEDPES